MAERAEIRPRMAEALEALAGEAVRENDMKGVHRTRGNSQRSGRTFAGYLYAGTAAAGLVTWLERRKTTKALYRSLPRNALGYAKIGAVRVAAKSDWTTRKAFDEGLKRDPKSYDALSGAALDAAGEEAGSGGDREGAKRCREFSDQRETPHCLENYT